MKREFLKGLGLDSDAIDKIMDENGKDIENAKRGSSDLSAEIDKLKEQVKERDKQLETLKGSTADTDALKKQIEALQAENKTKADEYARDIHNLKVSTAVETALLSAGAKNSKAVKGLLTGLDKAEFDEEGNVKGLVDQIKALQKSDSYLFEVVKPVKGARIGEDSDDTDKGITKEMFSKMSYKERNDLYNTDRETYDALAN